MSNPSGSLRKSQDEENEMTQCHRPELLNYTHSVAMNEIDRMNRDLNSLKEVMIKHSVRCHMLEVDLATQFSPDLQAALRSTEKDCIRCREALQCDNDQQPSMLSSNGEEQVQVTDQ
ncbi:uncharacterized protein LOC110442796 [Mizuhopecten yessoensis]|uniref:uncharacterized protein LOC110442796 n=1 Tax=Mizuhopecten yessoensis TaxID=6573 RepID=UPI000B45D868|nr:uncharacterized protein LOC110442796 [Mizuhopecten yessoensis]